MSARATSKGNMETLKRIIKKNPVWKKTDMFGITRMPYKSWWVRLGHIKKDKKRIVLFQKSVKDSDFDGDPKKSLLEAIKIVRENRSRYQPGKYIPPSNPVKGVYISRQATRSGKSYYYTWKFNWREEGTPNTKTFGFWRTGKIYEMYLRAVAFAVDKGVKIDHKKIDDYFFECLKKIDDPEPNCAHLLDISRLSNIEKFNLKRKYLKNTDETIQPVKV